MGVMSVLKPSMVISRSSGRVDRTIMPVFFLSAGAQAGAENSEGIAGAAAAPAMSRTRLRREIEKSLFTIGSLCSALRLA